MPTWCGSSTLTTDEPDAPRSRFPTILVSYRQLSSGNGSRPLWAIWMGDRSEHRLIGCTRIERPRGL
jgi:hypothetical protein